MKIRVEIGSSEQQKFIIDELGMLAEASQHFPLAFRIEELIVPNDFDATVNEIAETDTYRSIPGMEPLAKTIGKTDSKQYMLFHPRLFTGQFDTHIRYSIYWQEFSLLVNRGRFPVLTRHKLDKYANYFVNLYQLYDQYDAARKSYEFRDALIAQVLNEPLSAMAKQDLEHSLTGQLNILRNKAEYYDWITFQIKEYRTHKNMQQFLDAVKGKISQLSFATVLAYATMDHYEELREKESLIADSPMLNTRTRDFLEYLRSKYQENSADLRDGLELMEEFWANFGIRFVDGEKSLQCEVVDI